jgi:hypothetical protein
MMTLKYEPFNSISRTSRISRNHVIQKCRDKPSFFYFKNSAKSFVIPIYATSRFFSIASPPLTYTMRFFYARSFFFLSSLGSFWVSWVHGQLNVQIDSRGKIYRSRKSQVKLTCGNRFSKSCSEKCGRIDSEHVRRKSTRANPRDISPCQCLLLVARRSNLECTIPEISFTVDHLRHLLIIGDTQGMTHTMTL